MRASSPPPARARTTATAVFAAVAMLLLVPAAAADEHDEAEEPVVIEVEPAPGAGQEVEDAQVHSQPAADACTDVLLVVSPDGATGNEAAVAITAQAIDRDIDGWINVSWAAAAGTELSAVTVHRAEGTVTLVDDLATGSAQDVLELTFCGTSTAAAPAAPAPAPSTPASGGTSGGTGSSTGTSGGSTETSGGGGSTGTSSNGGTTDPAPSPSPEAPETPAADQTDGDDASDADDADDADDSPTTTDDGGGLADDTEVLGIQLTREDGGSGGLHAGVFALVLTGVAAAGAGGFLLARRFGLLGLGVVR